MITNEMAQCNTHLVFKSLYIKTPTCVFLDLNQRIWRAMFLPESFKQNLFFFKIYFLFTLPKLPVFLGLKHSSSIFESWWPHLMNSLSQHSQSRFLLLGSNWLDCAHWDNSGSFLRLKVFFTLILSAKVFFLRKVRHLQLTAFSDLGCGVRERHHSAYTDKIIHMIGAYA